ncbi:MAG: M23 family metallopeptidase [bacterium]
MTKLKGAPVFPLKERPWTNDWMTQADPKKRSSSFGSSRGERTHAGCDLHVASGTEVVAVAGGTVTDVSKGFPGNSQAIEVKHDGFIALYGEVVPASGVMRGKALKQSDVIATVANQGRESQLHFELYLNPGDKPSHVLLPAGMKKPPYQRRLTPEDPTPYLKEWLAKMPSES